MPDRSWTSSTSRSRFDRARSTVTAVDDVCFQIAPGETLGLVGESGSGKSVTAFSIMRLLQPPGRITGGRIVFEGPRPAARSPKREMRAGARRPDLADLPGADDGAQPGDARRRSDCRSAHRARPRRRAARRRRAVELLDAVTIPDAARRVRDYPHQLSGGMRQRVMIAIALACHPPLVIADEPTTALDVTIQAEVLDLLRELQAALNLSLLLITHDFGVIAEMADRVAVMYKGRLVEQGPVRQILRDPAPRLHAQLLAAVPGMRGTGGPIRPALDGRPVID